MNTHLVYLSLGGNIGDVVSTLSRAFEKISALPGTTDFKISSFYQTAPFEAPDQDDYINAACSFRTTLPLKVLWDHLQQVEILLGKTPKPKSAPRKIDIDLLFFGDLYLHYGELEIPHPRWQERLFVLIPLRDLTETVTVPFGPEHQVQQVHIDSLIKPLA